jgi:hypothetical protein
MGKKLEERIIMGKRASAVLNSTLILLLGVMTLSTFGLGQFGGQAVKAAGMSELAQLATSMEPGTWAELHTEGFTWDAIASSGDAGGNIFDYSDSATWDPNSHKLFFIGKGYAQRPWKFISYDEATNTWTHMPDPYWFHEGENGHGYDNNTIDAERGTFYHHKSATLEVFRYEVATDTWSMLPELPQTYIGHGTAIAYFPEMGGLIRVYTGRVHFFDESTRTWTEIADNLPMGTYHNIAEYSAGAKAMLIGGGNYGVNQIHRIDTDGKVTRLKDAPVGLASAGSVVTTDPVTGDFIVISGDDQALWSYDILQDEWRLISNNLPFDFGDSWGGHKTIPTPVSNYGVILFAIGHNGDAGQVFLYKHAPSENLKGDLNLDGVIDDLDADLYVQIILGHISDVDIVNRADVDGDGRVSILDLQKVINLILP